MESVLVAQSVSQGYGAKTTEKVASQQQRRPVVCVGQGHRPWYGCARPTMSVVNRKEFGLCSSFGDASGRHEETSLYLMGERRCRHSRVLQQSADQLLGSPPIAGEAREPRACLPPTEYWNRFADDREWAERYYATRIGPQQ